uniref:Uncharacterized protein n=2 Tax=Opuntia streptacantha TaxID=393608 RepID=A0A7C9CH10_OPUST
MSTKWHTTFPKYIILAPRIEYGPNLETEVQNITCRGHQKQSYPINKQFRAMLLSTHSAHQQVLQSNISCMPMLLNHEKLSFSPSSISAMRGRQGSLQRITLMHSQTMKTFNLYLFQECHEGRLGSLRSLLHQEH